MRDRLNGRLTIAFWVLALAFTILNAWAYRHDIRDVDGISYLDLADAYRRGDWYAAANAYWSPLYAWLLALALELLHPSTYYEYPAIQVVNILVVVAAMAAFSYFLGELTRYQRQLSTDSGAIMLPEWTWIVLGYSVLIWALLYWFYFWLPCPDVCVAALVFMAAAILLRVRAGVAGWRSSVALGVVLGLAYLAKAAMFPLGFVFVLVSLLAAPDTRRALPRSAATLLIFLVIAAPLVTTLSLTKGRLTFGDAGRINYVWIVNRAWGDHWPHWEGAGAAGGVPAHPSRVLSRDPAVYEFGSPVAGTYPMWYDPSYWYEGLTPRFDARQQTRRVIASASFYYNVVFTSPPVVLVVGLCVLCVTSRRRDVCVGEIARYWVLLVPALAALSMYAVVYVEARYVGAFMILVWCSLFAGVRLPDRAGSRRLIASTVVVMSMVLLASAVASSARDVRHTMYQQPPAFDGVLHWEIADALRQLGVRADDRVALIGTGMSACRWARLARVRIVAEAPDRGRFWLGSDDERTRVVRTLAATGVAVIVAEEVPERVSTSGWIRLGRSADYAYFVGRPRPPDVRHDGMERTP